MTAALGTTAKHALSLASAEAVARSYRSLRGYAARSRWLGVNNFYLSRLREKLKHLHNSGIQLDSQKEKHLSELIAASSLLHCSDGWMLLGKAVGSLLQGDSDTCRHLGYYAELRAAVALLAAAGVGVFDRHHFVVTSSGVIPLGQNIGTHAATWLVLENLAGLSSGPDLLARVVQPSGARLQEWIRSFPHHARWQQQGQVWFQALGLDLRRLAEDREARNAASYRPTRLVARPQLEAREAASFCRELWRSIEPVGRDPFEHLDRHLLRRSLAEHYRLATGLSASLDSAGFSKSVRAAVQTTIGSHELQDRLARFLVSTDPVDESQLITRALGQARVTDAGHHLEVLARGAILLRLATGAVREHFSSSGFSLGELGFWWRSLGTELGLWEEPPANTEVIDVWGDVADALADLEDWEYGGQTTYKSLTEDCGTAVCILGRCGLAVIWELAS